MPDQGPVSSELCLKSSGVSYCAVQACRWTCQEGSEGQLTGGKPDEEAISSGVHAGTMGQDAGQVQRVLQHIGKVLR